jgi:hypothetical protein
MPHIPINHRFQPAYRVLAALAGLFVLVFGIVGVVQASGESLFQQGDTSVFGLKLNLAFAIISIIVGVIVFFGALRGRNVDHFINLVGAAVFLGSGILMLGLLQTEANFLNFRVATCIVSFGIGLVLLVAGLYGKVAPKHIEAREEHFRMHHGEDPHDHKWAYHGAPPRPEEDHPDGHRFA